MMRSLYSGVSGLRVHQAKMDVIGNNIANVNTIGFKASSVNFSDIFYQTTQNASGPNAATGTAGQNAMQIGLGSALASITTSITQTGGSQRTDNPFDLMINGDSFFIVKSGGTNYFTKAGSFGVDADGNLCTPSGATVMGWMVDPNNPGKILVKEVEPLQVMSAKNRYSPAEATTDARVTGNINDKDLNLNPGEAGSPVSVSFFDALGHKYNAQLKVTRTSVDDPTKYDVTLVDITDENDQSIFVNKKADGTYELVDSSKLKVKFGNVEYAVTASDPTTFATTGKVQLTGGAGGVLTFDGTSGKFVSADAASGATTDKHGLFLDITATPDPFSNINIDFSTLKMSGDPTALTSERGSVAGTGKGKPVGNMSGISIDTSGKIYGTYDNGDKILLAQIATTTFANPSGLEAVGDNMYAETQNSGEFDGIGQDISANGGKFTPGVVEMSNVDLSAQFTDMITTQRGFQANSRIITTSDTMLEELVNLKR